jgi:hypothetical protein
MRSAKANSIEVRRIGYALSEYETRCRPIAFRHVLSDSMDTEYTVPDSPSKVVHILSYALPQAWESALDGWLSWLIAAGASRATQRTRRGHIRCIARELGCLHPREVSGADLLAIAGRPLANRCPVTPRRCSGAGELPQFFGVQNFFGHLAHPFPLIGIFPLVGIS